MKVKLKIESYFPDTQYLEGRIFFGSRGVYNTISFSWYMNSVLHVIDDMKIKQIKWVASIKEIPVKLLPYIKFKDLALMRMTEV